jgi:uncharacterized protein YjiS (DUF1127 family)
MSTYDLTYERATDAEAPGLIARLRQRLAAFRHRRRQRAAALELSRMDERLLRDIGIDPQDVLDALKGRGRSVLFHPVRRDSA